MFLASALMIYAGLFHITCNAARKTVGNRVDDVAITLVDRCGSGGGTGVRGRTSS